MTFIISPQWFSTHGVNDMDMAARTTPNQINQIFQQKDMPSELKQRYAKRLLKFRSVPNKEYLKELVKDPSNQKVVIFLSLKKVNFLKLRQ